MTLRKQQSKFARLLARLLDKAHELGFEATLGEAWRPPIVAEHYARTGRGISRSLHIDRLAIDINLFKDGQYLDATEAHRPLGEWWEQQDPDCRWGGRFPRPDGNHYSLAWEGRA